MAFPPLPIPEVTTSLNRNPGSSAGNSSPESFGLVMRWPLARIRARAATPRSESVTEDVAGSSGAMRERLLVSAWALAICRLVADASLPAVALWRRNARGSFGLDRLRIICSVPPLLDVSLLLSTGLQPWLGACQDGLSPQLVRVSRVPPYDSAYALVPQERKAR